MSVRVNDDAAVRVITIDRPHRRNAVDRSTAQALADAFRTFDSDSTAKVAVLTGAGDHFCAGADLQEIADGKPNRIACDGDGPMGPTRMTLRKPVLAAIEGYAVAGGLELAIWCDLRIASETAIFGVFCRRWGVPLIDGGTIRLPRLIGHSRAMDMILTGRSVEAQEAHGIGLVNRLVPAGAARATAIALARQLAQLPQQALNGDRRSAIEQWSLAEDAAMVNEMRHGALALEGEAQAGAVHFAGGAGRHGQPT